MVIVTGAVTLLSLGAPWWIGYVSGSSKVSTPFGGGESSASASSAIWPLGDIGRQGIGAYGILALILGILVLAGGIVDMAMQRTRLVRAILQWVHLGLISLLLILAFLAALLPAVSENKMGGHSQTASPGFSGGDSSFGFGGAEFGGGGFSAQASASFTAIPAGVVAPFIMALIALFGVISIARGDPEGLVARRFPRVRR